MAQSARFRVASAPTEVVHAVVGMIARSTAPARADAPPVSVVMPLFNRGDTVSSAIESVLTQSYREFELLVVDDGSTDDGPAIARSISDPRLRHIRFAENHGADAARNEGIRQARGRLLSFLDSDDAFLPNKLSTIVAIFERRSGLGGILDSFRKVYPADGGRSKLCLNPEIADREELLDALFNRRLWKATSAISVTREAAVRAGMFDEGLAARQDFDFLIRLIRTAPVVSIAEVTWEKTYTRDSISADLDGFLPHLLDFWDRHPEYYANARYRPGFAADVSRHLGKLLVQHRVDQAFSEAGLVADRIGWGGLISALCRGAIELQLLRRHRQDLWRRSTKSARTLELDRNVE